MNTKEPGERIKEALQNEETMLEVGRLATEEQKAVFNTKEQWESAKKLDFECPHGNLFGWCDDCSKEYQDYVIDFIRETREQAYQKGLDDGYDEGFRACEKGVTP